MSEANTAGGAAGLKGQAAALKTRLYEGMNSLQIKKTVEEAVQKAKEAVGIEEKKGLIRGATEKAAELYAAAKEKSPPTIKAGLDSVEAKTAGVTAKVGEVASPYIDSLDGRLDSLSLKVKEIYHLSPADYMNYITVKGNEWKSWGTELFHFDLVAYCKEITRKADEKKDAKPTPAEAAQVSIAKAVEQLDATRKNLEASIAASKTQTAEQAAAGKAQLQAQLKAAADKANELSAAGVAFVNTKKASLPQPAQKSVDFILASPAKFKEVSEQVKAKADLDSSKATLDNVNNLLLAVKEVLYGNVVQTAEAEKPKA